MDIVRETNVSGDTLTESNSPVFVICPADKTTGGPELLHQLVGLLRSTGRDASIVYFPFRRGHQVPEPYRQYGVRIGLAKEITQASIVVVPETSAWKLLRLPKCEIYFWWLSVDNFWKEVVANRSRHLFPATVVLKAALALVKRRTAAHLFQSEYARLFCVSRGLEPLHPLSDYLSPAYVDAARVPRNEPRDNIVLFNPAKGMERTQLILDRLAAWPEIQTVPIRGMDRDQVLVTMSRAKLYIDFGEHPGKDRLPREAAALGCCVLTNRRGSAANDRDVPIPARYKLDDMDPAFAPQAAELIVKICADFGAHASDFDNYRKVIAQEPEVFAAEASRIFGNPFVPSRLGMAYGREAGG